MPVTASAQTTPEDPGEGDCAWYDLLCHLQAFAEWLLCIVVGWVNPILVRLFDALPVDWIQDLSPVLYYLRVANGWVPLEEGVSIGIGLLVFQVVHIAVMYLWKLMPFTG